MSQRYLGGIITANPTLPTLSSASGVWTLEQDFQNSASITPQVIGRSSRFRSSATAYYSRTPATATNQRTWTWSGWVKRGLLGATSYSLLAAGPASNTDFFYFGFEYSGNADQLVVIDYPGGSSLDLRTTPVFRDPSAWYHVVLAIDTTQATAANRAKIYVNGVQITAFGSATYPSQNNQTRINSTNLHYVGAARFASSPVYPFDGYMTEVNFVDGQQLTPSSFGAFDTNGIWQPLSYRGTYGTNGYYLNFSDPTSTTTIGYDYSGNGNNWASNNISVTAGVTYDSMTDSPTNSASASNYAVLNPLYKGYGGYTATPVTISNANLTITGNPSANNIAATMALPTSGQFYYEYVWTATSGGEMDGGIIGETGTAYFYRYDGTYWNGSSYVAYGASYTTNDVIGVAVDTANLTFTFYKNGTSQGTKTAAFPSGVTYFPWFYTSNTVAASVNFGQRPFAYTPPTGFLALNTQNLSAVTINKGGSYMAATLYTGNSATSTAGTTARTLTGTGFQPDLVWVKSINNGGTWSNHSLTDSVRGANLSLSTNSTDPQYNVTTDFSQGGVGAPSSDGFTIVSGTAGGTTNLNSSSGTYVAWQWKAGGTAVSNTSGSITSSVSASTTAGFSVVTYTGTGSAATVGHGLGVAPNMVIYKRRSSGSDNWVTYHSSISNSQNGGIYLNLTNAWNSDSTLWNNTAPTSSVFTVGTYGSASTVTMVAYCFAAVAGYSAFGSYTGNGSTDGAFVYLGFRPRFLMFKKSSGASNWSILDTSRDTYNVADNPLLPNSSAAESTSTSGSGAFADILSNGFKARGTSGDINDSATYIYMAFAENPFNISRAR